MPNYIVDPTLFHAEGAVVNWTDAARRLGIKTAVGAVPQFTVELRWMIRGTMGMPTEPFQVWARPQNQQPLDMPLSLTQFTLIFAGNVTIVTWTNGSMSHVTVDITAPVAGFVWAFAGAPLASNVVAYAPIGAGQTVVQISGSIIEGLSFTPGIIVSSATGIETSALSRAAGWNPIELVGLPVKAADWAGIGKHGEPEGPTGAFTDAQAAAVQRLKRAAPLVGWAADLAAGVPAPPWTAPDFTKLVAEVNARLLDDLRPVVAGFAPDQQGAQKINVPLPPPQNSSGQQMTVQGSTSQVAPLSVLLMAASTDPFLNLVLGFGTGYPYTPNNLAALGVTRTDFMITAHYEKGLDGKSAPADFAAIVPAPGGAPPPPPPANLVTPLLGMLRPIATDGSWRASSRVSWDRPLDSQLFRMSSFAVARAGIAPHATTAGLMESRDSGGFRPVAVNNAATTPPDPEAWRMHTVDQEMAITTNPGSAQIKYGIAIQDIYGQWSPWNTADTTLQQPELEPVRIAKATLYPTLPAVGTSCPASLEIEFMWDWRIRSLQQVSFVGYLYAAATTGDLPSSMAVPAGLPRSIGGAQPAFVLTFNGADVPVSTAGVTVIALNEAGDTQVSFGNAQGDNRRFRATLDGLLLDFGPTGHVALALWAQGQEHIAPQRTSAWSDQPTVISTSDPRPPVVPTHSVTLASLPDAAGQSHTQLTWTAQANASGYFIYEASETSVLQANGLHEVSPEQTLDQRLLVLRNAFHANPSRTPFTRLNSTLLQSTSTDVTLPRGSTSIHLYVVLGVSAGQVESAWPGDPQPEDSLMAIAAPHIMQPAPPTIEVTSFLDTSETPAAYKANISIATRPGPRPRKVELHRVRVDDAAKELDSMGPPIVRLQPTAAGWNVTQTVDSNGLSFIATAVGQDAPTGSWRRVWYRATAWTDLDIARGGLPGRSPASNAAWVMLPPSDPPSISALAQGSGPMPRDILLEWTSAAPLKNTPLGPHKMAVRAVLAGVPPKADPVLSVDSALSLLPTTQPVTGSGVWIVMSTPGHVVYRALIRRALVTDTIKFAVRITDPIGRTGEQVATFAGGPIDPAPDLSALTVQKIVGPPARVLLSFSTSVPLFAPLDGPYTIKVVATFKAVNVLLPAPIRAIELPVGSIPTTLRPPGPSPEIQIVRGVGTGPTHAYIVSCLGPVTGFDVKVAAHDGRTIEKTQVVS